MAKKKKDFRESTIENYYDIKADKVDELVAVLKNEDREFDDISMNISDCTGVDDPKNYTRSGKQRQFDPYKTDFLARVPTWIKAFFIKFWFAGAVCYFVMWGLGLDSIDGVIFSGLFLGMVVDVLVNPLFRYLETDRKEYNSYMMFPYPFKAFWTFFTNLLYYTAVLLCVSLFYRGINVFINFIASSSNYIYVGVEPLLFGFFALIIDMVFIGMKDLVVYLAKKHKNLKTKESANV